MKDSIRSAEYSHVLVKLVEMRNKAGMTQRDLARELRREHSFVWRIETGKRRLDVVEFYWVCKALGRNASVVYQELIRRINAMAKTATHRKRGSNLGMSRKIHRRK